MMLLFACSKEELRAAFRSYDVDKKGFISFHDAKKFLQRHPFNFSKKKVSSTPVLLYTVTQHCTITSNCCCFFLLLKVKVVDLCSERLHNEASLTKALRYSTHCQGIPQFYLHTLRFIRKRNEPYLPLPSQPQLPAGTHLPTP